MPGFFSDLFSGAGDVLGGIFGGGGGGGGGIDWSSTTPFDAVTVAGSDIAPMDIFSNVAGLVTPSALSGFGDLISGGLSGFLNGGGSTAPTRSPLTSLLHNPGVASSAGGAVRNLLGGGATGATPAAGTPTRQPVQTNVPGLVTPQALNDAASGITSGGGVPGLSGLGGTLSSLLGNPALAAMIPGIFQAINSKDQTNLGPDAAAMRAIATGNEDTVKSLRAEAAAEKNGQLPGQAMASLSRSLEEQKTALRQRYSQMGMSGSTAEGDDMAALNAKGEQDRFAVGLNMANEGLAQVSSLTGADVGIYQNLMQAQAERDKEYMDAMATLAEGLGKAFSTPGAPAGAASGGGVTSDGTETRGTKDPAAPPGLLPLGADFLSTVLPGIDLSTLITPQTNVPDLITPASLPSPSQMDTTTWNPDQSAAADFLGMFDV